MAKSYNGFQWIGPDNMAVLDLDEELYKLKNQTPTFIFNCGNYDDNARLQNIANDFFGSTEEKIMYIKCIGNWGSPYLQILYTLEEMGSETFPTTDKRLIIDMIGVTFDYVLDSVTLQNCEFRANLIETNYMGLYDTHNSIVKSDWKVHNGEMGMFFCSNSTIIGNWEVEGYMKNSGIQVVTDCTIIGDWSISSQQFIHAVTFAMRNTIKGNWTLRAGNAAYGIYRMASDNTILDGTWTFISDFVLEDPSPFPYAYPMMFAEINSIECRNLKIVITATSDVAPSIIIRGTQLESTDIITFDNCQFVLGLRSGFTPHPENVYLSENYIDETKLRRCFIHSGFMSTSISNTIVTNLTKQVE